MKEIDHTVGINCKIIIKEIGPITETGHIVEIDHKTTVEMTIGKKIIGISKIRDIREIIADTGHTTEIGHIVETGHEAIATKMTIETTMKMIIGMIIGMTVEMTIRKPIKVTFEEKTVGISETRGIKEGIETIVNTSVKMVYK